MGADVNLLGGLTVPRRPLGCDGLSDLLSVSCCPQETTMGYCINPRCTQRSMSDRVDRCQTCGTPLWIRNRYRLVQPLSSLAVEQPMACFRVEDRQAEPERNLRILQVLNQTSPQRIKAFVRQANILQQMDGMGFPRVADGGYFTLAIADSVQTLHCLVLEEISGHNLVTEIERNGPVSEIRARQWLSQLARTLQQLHQLGGFHGSIQPGSLLLRNNEELVLVPFTANQGIAISSSGYVPIEQLDGRAVRQSDFFAVGRTICYALSGRHPEDLPQDGQTERLLWQDFAPQVSTEFARLIDDLSATFSGSRPQTARDILQRLDGLPAHSGRKRSLKQGQIAVEPPNVSDRKERLRRSNLWRDRLVAPIAVSLGAAAIGWQWLTAMPLLPVWTSLETLFPFDCHTQGEEGLQPVKPTPYPFAISLHAINLTTDNVKDETF